jgi:YD repeat-containing protein
MDRRQVLVGMTAMGVVGSLNLNDLVSAQCMEPATKSTIRTASVKYAHLSNGEQRALLGPIKMCVEKRASISETRVWTTEFGPDRKLLSVRLGKNGHLKQIYPRSDDVYPKVRDAQGRILKYKDRDREGAIQETFYDYDQDGRLLTISNDQNSDRTVFHYQPDGSKTSVQTFDPKTIEETKNGGYNGSAWEPADLGFGVPMGGTVTMTYDLHDNPTELQIHTADGQRLTRIVRTYDPQGRLTEERTLEKNLAFYWLEQKRPDGATYTYDSNGRITKKCEWNIPFEHTTTILYNEHGDKAEERHTFEDNVVGEGHFTNVPSETGARYTYQYDSYGNWTEKIETINNGTAFISRRTITYY